MVVGLAQEWQCSAIGGRTLRSDMRHVLQLCAPVAYARDGLKLDRVTLAIAERPLVPASTSALSRRACADSTHSIRLNSSKNEPEHSSAAKARAGAGGKQKSDDPAHQQVCAHAAIDVADLRSTSLSRRPPWYV